MKAILTRASDLNRGSDERNFVEIKNLQSIRHLLMKVEHPVVVMFAREMDAPAEIEIMVYDDYIEHYIAVGDDE